jgi:hypothetical protein
MRNDNFKIKKKMNFNTSLGGSRRKTKENSDVM